MIPAIVKRTPAATLTASASVCLRMNLTMCSPWMDEVVVGEDEFAVLPLVTGSPGGLFFPRMKIMSSPLWDGSACWRTYLRISWSTRRGSFSSQAPHSCESITIGSLSNSLRIPCTALWLTTAHSSQSDDVLQLFSILACQLAVALQHLSQGQGCLTGAP